MCTRPGLTPRRDLRVIRLAVNPDRDGALLTQHDTLARTSWSFSPRRQTFSGWSFGNSSIYGITVADPN